MTRLRILIVEDDPNRIEKFGKKLRYHTLDFATLAADAIVFLQNNAYDLILLDHDLGGGAYEPSDEHSGYGVAEYMAANHIDAQVVVHSLNPAGAKRILQVLPHAVRIPYINLFDNPSFMAILTDDA